MCLIVQWYESMYMKKYKLFCVLMILFSDDIVSLKLC